MKESTTYQAIVEEGRAEGLLEGYIFGVQRMLVRQGRIRFGPPSKANLAVLRRITELARLEDLSERLLIVDSWQELLRTNGMSSKRRTR